MSTLYRVRATVPGVREQRFAGSMAGVREAKASLQDKHGLKRSQVDHEELEVEFSKSGVITFLNEYCTTSAG